MLATQKGAYPRDVANTEVCRFADLLDLMYHGQTFINSNRFLAAVALFMACLPTIMDCFPGQKSGILRIQYGHAAATEISFWM